MAVVDDAATRPGLDEEADAAADDEEEEEEEEDDDDARAGCAAFRMAGLE